MACLEKIKHDVSWCTSERGLQVFYDDGRNKFTGYCFSCASRGLEAYVENPYADGVNKEPPKKKPREEVEAEIAEIRALQYPNFQFRGIKPEYFQQSGVRMAFSEFDGKTPNSFNFPYTLGGKLVRYKVIVLKEKVMWSIGEVKDVDLFNWEIAKKKGSKRLYVTEGEWDCLSLEQILDEYYGQNGKYKHAVVSLPNGVGSAVTTLGRMRKEIESLFDEVVLVFDSDAAGAKATKDVQKIWPEILEAPHVSGIKDANEALNSKSKNVFADYVRWKARKPPIQGVVTVSEIMSKGDDPSVRGYSYPWETLDKVLYGQYMGESLCIAGAVGSGKCQGYNTPILMYDGSIKLVQDVVVGDLLMGDDSTPREVLSTVVGRDEMFKVIPVKGETYTFNKDHILAIYITNSARKYLKDADGVKHYSGCKSTITVDTYLRSSKQFKRDSKLYRVAVDFKDCLDDLPVPPYILGLWLGDGSTDYAAITTKDSVVKEAWIEWGMSIGCDFRVEAGKGCETIYLKTDRGQDNPALQLLRSLGVAGNKHIPKQYKTASRQDRLELLAGILDTDGSLQQGCFDLTLKIKTLADDVSFIAKSVGLYSKVVECKKTIKSLSFEGTYFRQSISGTVDLIPTKLKKAGKRFQAKDVKVTGFTVEPVGVDNYYGFELSGNRLYVLGDFIVTHNTAIAHELMAHNMIQHKLPCFAVLLEETNIKTIRNICGKIDNLMYSNPEVLEANKERMYETARMLENMLYVWNSAGNTSIRFDIKEVLSAIRYNHLEYGCMMFYIDNMTKLVDGLTSGEANEFINKYSSELANLASELGVHIGLFSHLNPPQKGVDHEHGGQIFLSQLTGSRGVMRSFATALGFERNQYAPDGKDQNSFLRVLKNREHGDKIAVKTQYSKVTGRLLEFNWEGNSLTTEDK